MVKGVISGDRRRSDVGGETQCNIQIMYYRIVHSKPTQLY